MKKQKLLSKAYDIVDKIANVVFFFTILSQLRKLKSVEEYLKYIKDIFNELYAILVYLGDIIDFILIPYEYLKSFIFSIVPFKIQEFYEDIALLCFFLALGGAASASKYLLEKNKSTSIIDYHALRKIIDNFDFKAPKLSTATIYFQLLKCESSAGIYLEDQNDYPVNFMHSAVQGKDLLNMQRSKVEDFFIIAELINKINKFELKSLDKEIKKARIAFLFFVFISIHQLLYDGETFAFIKFITGATLGILVFIIFGLIVFFISTYLFKKIMNLIHNYTNLSEIALEKGSRKYGIDYRQLIVEVQKELLDQGKLDKSNLKKYNYKKNIKFSFRTLLKKNN